MSAFETARRIFREPGAPSRALLIAGCLFCFLASLAVRCLDARHWDDPALWLDLPASNQQTESERIMGTHDAYYWLAGAERIGSATNSAMAVFLDVGARLTGIPDGLLAFWTPAVAASLVAVAGFLWGCLAVGPGVGVLVGLVGALCPGFYFRTRLGYFDTDIATLFFPLAIGLGLAWWIQPLLRSPWRESGEQMAAEPRRGTLFPLWLGFFAAFGAWWHGDVARYTLLAVWTTLALVLVLGRRGAKGGVLLGLALFTLAALGGWTGAVAGLILGLALRAWPGRVGPLARQAWLPALLVLLVFGATGNLIHPVQYGLAKIATYLKPVAQEAATGNLTFPSIAQSVVEAQNITARDILERLMPWPWLAALGFAGFGLLVLVRPVALLLLPLVALSLMSVKIGGRMAMFGGPAVALGLGGLFLWFLRWYLPQRLWRAWSELAIPGLLGLGLIAPWVPVYLEAPATPVLSKPHALALASLSELTTPGSQIWTWWDWGYATDYYARRKSFADGGKHSGPRVFPVGLALISPSPLQANQIIRFTAAASRNGSDGSEQLSQRSPAEVQGFIESLARERYSFPKRQKQYLVVTWENFRLLYWIAFYGAWDFNTRSGTHVRSVEIRQPFSWDENTGAFSLAGEAPLTLKSADVFSAQGRFRRSYANEAGPHFLYNAFTRSGFLMDDAAYDSMAVQLLLSDVNDPRFTPHFHLVWEGSPEVRIYEVL